MACAAFPFLASAAGATLVAGNDDIHILRSLPAVYGSNAKEVAAPKAVGNLQR